MLQVKFPALRHRTPILGAGKPFDGFGTKFANEDVRGTRYERYENEV
jgi:hypothetical protein